MGYWNTIRLALIRLLMTKDEACSWKLSVCIRDELKLRPTGAYVVFETENKCELHDRVYSGNFDA